MWMALSCLLGVFDAAGAREAVVWLSAQAKSKGTTQSVEDKMVSAEMLVLCLVQKYWAVHIWNSLCSCCFGHHDIQTSLFR